MYVTLSHLMIKGNWYTLDSYTMGTSGLPDLATPEGHRPEG